MNRGSSLPQQMVGGIPSWWSMSNLRPISEETSPLFYSNPVSSNPDFPHQYLQTTSSLSLNSLYQSRELPQSWSHLLPGGLVGEEERYILGTLRKTMNWEEQLVHESPGAHAVDVKQENCDQSTSAGYEHIHGRNPVEETQAGRKIRASWSLPVSSPKSCITSSLSSNILDLPNRKLERRQPYPDHSSECNNTETAGALKKARVQCSSSLQSSIFKVRKEKLGDRIAALHQLVSPFGKTDTASVLLEAISYIRFLQSQIQALSSPYLASGSGDMRKTTQGERSYIFPKDHGQDYNEEPLKNDLRSRGLCLVPVSCTIHFGSDNGADYLAAPTIGGRFQ